MKADAIPVGFRLRSARGHLDEVIRMVEEDRYCIDVLYQLSAVQGALDRVRRDIWRPICVGVSRRQSPRAASTTLSTSC